MPQDGDHFWLVHPWWLEQVADLFPFDIFGLSWQAVVEEDPPAKPPVKKALGRSDSSMGPGFNLNFDLDNMDLNSIDAWGGGRSLPSETACCQGNWRQRQEILQFVVEVPGRCLPNCALVEIAKAVLARAKVPCHFPLQLVPKFAHSAHWCITNFVEARFPTRRLPGPLSILPGRLASGDRER